MTSENYVPLFFDIETTGFNPMAQQWWDNNDYGARVTAIGIGRTDDTWKDGYGWQESSNDVMVLWDESEYSLLKIANKRLEEIVGDYHRQGYAPFLVTFNGREFDHPYLGARFSRLRLNGDWFNHKLKRLDMMRALGKHLDSVGRYPSEDDCLEAMGIESEDPHDGSDMPDAYGRKEWSVIEEHVTYDVKEMMLLFYSLPGACMKEFYDHYDIDQDADYTKEVEF